MMKSHGSLSGALLCAVLAVVLAAVPARGVSIGTCVMNLGVDYLSSREAALPGDHVRVQLTVGTGVIQGGTRATLHAVRFFLQCNGPVDHLLPCVQEGTVVAYGGDDTITTTCPGATWATGHAAAARPNQVVFMPSVPIDVPAGNPAYCQLEFDVVVLGMPRARTPGVIEQLFAVGFDQADAICDNGVRGVVGTMSGLRVCDGCN